MNDDIKALADRLAKIEERLYALERGWVTAPTLANPEPMPEWRALVGLELAYECEVARSAEQALARVLWLLTQLVEGDDTSQQLALARIVAVCEAQVGDGWQADPSDWRRGAAHGLRGLIYALGFNEYWKPLGNRAAAWLRDLTEADA